MKTGVDPGSSRNVSVAHLCSFASGCFLTFSPHVVKCWSMQTCVCDMPNIMEPVCGRSWILSLIPAWQLMCQVTYVHPFSSSGFMLGSCYPQSGSPRNSLVVSYRAVICTWGAWLLHETCAVCISFSLSSSTNQAAENPLLYLALHVQHMSKFCIQV